MKPVDMDIQKYCLDHSSQEDEVLYKIYRKTYLNQIYPRMLSGHYQGVLLKMISKMIKPDCVLEIGTFTAYSAICLASGLKDGGKLITLEKQDELEKSILENIEMAGMSDRIKLISGDAKENIPALDHQFDLVFIDADKENYPEYLELIYPKVKRGGFILADNVLWGGKVLTHEPDDKETKGIFAFNSMVKEHPGLEKVLLPIRDGLYLIRKI